ERRADEAERRAQALESRLAAIEARLTPGAAQNNIPQPPNPKDYDGGEYDSRYLSAVARYHAEQAAYEAAARAKKADEEVAKAKEANERAREFTEKREALFAKGAEKYDDFEEVVADGGVKITE